MLNKNQSEGVPASASEKVYTVTVKDPTQRGGKLRRKSNKKRKYNKRKVNSHKKRKPKRKSRKSLRRL